MDSAACFKEAFGEVVMDQGLKDFFADVTVERVMLKKSMNLVNVYISYDRLIPKRYIYALEGELRRSFFGPKGLDVKIIEDYRLSDRYDAAYVVENYYDSLLMEVDRNDKLMHTVLRKQTPRVDEGFIIISLPDSFLARQKEKEILNVFDKIFEERFHLDVSLKVEYCSVEESNFRKENEARARHRLESIKRDIDERQNRTQEEPAENEMQDEMLGEKKKKPESVKPAESEKQEKKDKTKGKEKKKRTKLKMSDNPDVLYGRDFEGVITPIEDIKEEIGDVIIHGQVLKIDTRTIKSGATIIKLSVSDFSDAITVKSFFDEGLDEEFLAAVKEKDFIKVKGRVAMDTYDRELGISNIYGIKKIPAFVTSREDYSDRKRVELHAHSKMSDMDGICGADELVKMAKAFGHKAVAVTDHGNVQGYPEAFHALKKGDGFKVIYGLEAYLVDDTKKLAVNEKGQSLDDAYVVFDIETTGFVPSVNKIIEIGAVKVENGKITDRFSEFINPECPIPLEIEKLTSITDAMVAGAGTVDEILPKFLDFCGGCVLVAHNAKFDTSFIKHYATKLGLSYDFTHTDTIELARLLLPRLSNYKLDHVAKELNIPPFHHHRAVDDAEATAHIFLKELEMLKERKISTLAQLNEQAELDREKIADLFAYHATVLAKNEVGRRNLYKLVSESHLEYFCLNPNRPVPKIPISRLALMREGLIIGSGCSEGELYQALVEDKTDEEISRIAEFYDFLEIQPAKNNIWMLEHSKMPTLKTEEDLIEINKKIVRLGEEHRKPVVATGDVHYLNPEDAIYRSIVLSSRRVDKVHNDVSNLYFHTTEEMLKEFEYLGSDKADEVVITNSNLIADMCDFISPVRPDKCAPVIPDSDKTLRTICYNKAHEMYGEQLPEVVEERLERELKSIIGNGFAVMYIIAQKLVWKSVEDGYLVGSRGSVGSSFVATMAGITEVNPLSPHYYCPECHYSDFDSEDVKAYAGKAGCDMPDKDCPVCGAKLKKDGFDIPFETFLGFKGDKEPDIDLNFSGEYQSKAHKYTEVIFGAGQTFRAGTIGTLADKTAYGYVMGYYRDRGIEKKSAEVERMSSKMVGIRRTTGQHPGGIVVLPVGEHINSFTPTQHPANDMTTDTVTTHFDYHSIDHNLLKLDILGHDDPTMIRMLQDLTGIDPVKIPLDDPEVMSLFKDTHALNITPEDIGGTKLGALGIPEFGTDFAMGMLIDADPQSFSDLVRIAGLSHGTDVWLGNAQDLIKSGTATISTAICTRDDIMTYLIGMGVDPAESFNIMENVRKGKVAGHKVDEQWAVWKEDMLAHNVPQWYIDSAAKIKYMFPKAHAAAYVMMAWRIAYCKINYPLAYYTAYFSIRASAFDYELMCQGKARLEENMAVIKKKIDDKTASPKDEGAYKDMRIVQEMYARGFNFMPIDLYKAQAKYFSIVDGKIMPAFTAIDGLGDKNAELIEYEAAKGAFLSKEDFSKRTKTSQTLVETMSRLGILEGMTESNQISLFDML